MTWNLTGVVIDEVTSVPNPDPSIAGAHHSGGLVGGANYPTCDNTSPYDNAFSCVSTPVLDSTGAYSVQTSLYVVNQAACTASNTLRTARIVESSRPVSPPPGEWPAGEPSSV